jgi:hypothetical protein
MAFTGLEMGTGMDKRKKSLIIPASSVEQKTKLASAIYEQS